MEKIIIQSKEEREIYKKLEKIDSFLFDLREDIRNGKSIDINTIKKLDF